MPQYKVKKKTNILLLMKKGEDSLLFERFLFESVRWADNARRFVFGVGNFVIVENWPASTSNERVKLTIIIRKDIFIKDYHSFSLKFGK